MDIVPGIGWISGNVCRSQLTRVMFIDVSIVVAGWALESSLTRPKPMTYDFKQLQNLSDAQCLHHLNEGDDNSSITGLF